MRVKIDKHDVKSCKVLDENDCETGVLEYMNILPLPISDIAQCHASTSCNICCQENGK